MSETANDLSSEEEPSGETGRDTAVTELKRRAPKRAPNRGLGNTDERVGEVRADNMGERCSMLNYPKISIEWKELYEKK